MAAGTHTRVFPALDSYVQLLLDEVSECNIFALGEFEFSCVVLRIAHLRPRVRKEQDLRHQGGWRIEINTARTLRSLKTACPTRIRSFKSSATCFWICSKGFAKDDEEWVR
jgi:hypothetical protein